MVMLNGWSAATGIKTYRVPGTSTYLPVKASVAPLLIGFAAEFNQKVQPLHTGWCWGYAYRAVRGYATLSFHAFGLAIDLNAPAHPLGRSGTFSWRQRATINALCKKYGLRWGGNYSGRKDEMHFECILSPAQAASRIKALQTPPAPKWPGKPSHFPHLAKLKYGQKNTDIAYFQGRLSKFGVNPGPHDGHFGSKTRDALIRLQKRFGGKGDGVMNAWTYEKMYRRAPR